ncbi:hypothetical protein SLEP1_g15779 [Rubroshorea leprosula]|uniref:Reverse transcriptase Ty1/copia-type domain-containing protein n=1 Tax=Rubroshorea leprosula TaxID=152421 RepID=A0AAV5IZA1_9ROSI|nr:hypothetical protein SLEP1_g15779 [Rubroshorea leprosula]
MQEEIDALHKNNTWTLVPPPSETNIVGSRWVFKTKLNPNRTVGRFKARLVARGFSQMPGVDFEETFSPILKPTTLWLVLAFATTLEWPLRQLDVKNAFLHGKLKEMVYMTQPPGFEDPKYPHYVCQLNCSIYGLKQAPKAWCDTFTLYLLKMGFHCNQADSSFFVLHNPKGTAFLLVYVDDIVLTTSSDDLLQNIISHLSREFALKDLGDLQYFLGIEVDKFSGGIFLSQAKYAHDILTRASMLEASSIATPLATKENTTSRDCDLVDAHEYRRIVGALQYLTITKIGICHAVNRDFVMQIGRAVLLHEEALLVFHGQEQKHSHYPKFPSNGKFGICQIIKYQFLAVEISSLPTDSKCSASPSFGRSSTSADYHQGRWILGTMNEESLSLVVGYDSALQIWRCLEEHYLASSKESELHLKGQLATKRGDGESLDDFIIKFKRTCDNLAAICKPVANLDKVFQLSRVVGTRYQPYNLAVLSKAPYPTFNQYTSGLLNNERDLQV